jgi:hypothetical protein
MSVRLDPRRRDQLKRLAAEAEMRPGELVTRWVIERLDAKEVSEPATAPPDGTRQALEALAERVAALESRLAEPASSGASAEPSTRGSGHASGTREKDKRSRAGSTDDSDAGVPRRVALHDEIAAVIAERGPLPASEIAALIAERDRYRPPRSSHPIDATTVSARVSNPHYRHRFVRREGRIGLAEG